jgi:hypothetical protein
MARREVSLEEYFGMSQTSREEYVDDIAEMLNAWEPSIRSHIDEILLVAIATQKWADNSDAAAVELLKKIKSMQVVHALRREIGKPDSDDRTKRVNMLFEAVSQNIFIDYDTRFSTIEYYVQNPRYKLNESMKLRIIEVLYGLNDELQEKKGNLLRVLDAAKQD